MIGSKNIVSKSRKKRSVSEYPDSRPNPYYKLVIQTDDRTNNNGQTRSTSSTKNNNKARIKTDYDEYSNEFEPYGNPLNGNSRSLNKKSFEGRMRDRKSLVLGIGG